MLATQQLHKLTFLFRQIRQDQPLFYAVLDAATTFGAGRVVAAHAIDVAGALDAVTGVLDAIEGSPFNKNSPA